MKFIVVVIALFLVQFQLPCSVYGVSSKLVTALLNKLDGLAEELKNLDTDSEPEKTDNREVGTQPPPWPEIGKIKDVLLRAFENEKLVLRKSVSKMDSVVSLLRSEVEHFTEVLAQTEEVSRDFKRHVTSEMIRMEDVIEKQEHKSLGLEQQVTDLRREKDVLMDKYTEGTLMQGQINRNSETLSHLNEHVGAIDHNMSDVSKSLQKIADDLGDHKRGFFASIQETVANREKCQSGDGVGASSFDPPPVYPATVTVKFKHHFKRRPVVVFGLKYLDSDRSSNVRMNAHIVELTNTYFKLRITTWAGTVMYGVGFSWMACPT